MNNDNNTMVRFDNVSIVFGDNPNSALPLMDKGLSREDVLAQCGQTLGVHNCTLDVAESEIVVLMGLSGSGKSTLLRAVNGLNKIARGAVKVRDGDGLVDVGSAGEAALCRLRTTRVAMVFQQFALLPWRSVSENVGFGLEIAGVPAAERRERAQQQLKLVGLDGLGARRVHELSGGMQQRVGLARAFATEAPILLMDEPFSALDPLIRAKLQDELLELQRDIRRTIVFVSHDLDEAVKLGSRIAIMDGGRIVQLAAPREILLRPANEYVAEFVSHMNPFTILRAAEVMRPLEGVAPAGARVMPAAASVRDLIEACLEDPGDIVISGEDGAVGVVSGDDIMRSLLLTRS
ncbi:MAG: choline ABC transporter ATP-binding protein [Alphaproteobacteria bacterium]|nr:choline ABC transporter ATP-binding protein [Alphaproteobacteria bacterium]MDA7989255.1 choline ABC transporter ATP-binding protein [Alphaproteobacteria bacterium]